MKVSRVLPQDQSYFWCRATIAGSGSTPSLLMHGDEFEQAARVLAARDGMVAGGPDPRQAAIVLRRPNRLLEPVQSETGEGGIMLQGFFDRPRAVGIEHDPGVVSGGLDRRRDHRHRDFVQLDPAIAFANGAPHRRRHRVLAAVAHKARIDFDTV